MVRPGRYRLYGHIDVDETYMRGIDTGGKREHGSEKNKIVVIALDVHSLNEIGHIWMHWIPDVPGESLMPFV